MECHCCTMYQPSRDTQRQFTTLAYSQCQTAMLYNPFNVCKEDLSLKLYFEF